MELLQKQGREKHRLGSREPLCPYKEVRESIGLQVDLAYYYVSTSKTHFLEPYIVIHSTNISQMPTSFHKHLLNTIPNIFRNEIGVGT